MSLQQAPEPRTPHTEFATELKRQRKDVKGWTQVRLSAETMRLGDPIAQGLISQYESGECGVGDAKTATLSKALDCGMALFEARFRDAMRGGDEDSPRGYLALAA